MRTIAYGSSSLFTAIAMVQTNDYNGLVIALEMISCWIWMWGVREREQSIMTLRVCFEQLSGSQDHLQR